jgi:LPXTG-motif cell wall-anchored protein
MLFGWGLFNLVEGVVDHHILGIHHVRETGNQTAWDLAFLGFGALLITGGWLLTRTERRPIRS